MASVFCNQCGHRNPPDANFCSSCGAPLDVARDDRTIVFHHVDELQESSSADDDVVVHLDEIAPGTGVLVLRNGPDAGLRLRLDQPVIRIGRNPENDLQLDDITVSRRHAEVRHGEGGYDVTDLGSLNGTYVNRRRVDSAHLEQGDELQVGKYKMVYLSGPDEA